jgi:hypothetical protein
MNIITQQLCMASQNVRVIKEKNSNHKEGSAKYQS